MKRYGNITYVLKLSLPRAVELISVAREGEQKENLYRLWLVRYPNYTQETYESFEDFCEKHISKRQVVDARSKEDIMQELLSI